MTTEIETGHSRRDFLRSTLAGSTVMVVVRPFESFAATPIPTTTDAQPLPPSSWQKNRRIAPHRYEALAKVMGEKVYARDLRARDLKGWPVAEQRVVILRAHRVDRDFLGVDEDKIRTELGVEHIVTAVDIEKLGAKADGFYTNWLFAAKGAPAHYLGQPLALLYFTDADKFFDAQTQLMDSSAFVRYSEAPSAKKADAKAYAQSRIVRYTDAQGQELFSYVKDGTFSAPWQEPDEKGSTNARAAYFAQKLQEDVTASNWNQFHGSYSTQGVDPMFMEPECGLAWYNPQKEELQLTWGTQSPLDDGDACAHMLEKAAAIPLKSVIINSCYPGGGFGGRDRSEFPLFLALAAVCRPGMPVRIVHSRFDQFQAGLKRHPAVTQVSLAIGAEGRFEALHTDITLDGGGENNYSFAVQNVGARNASSGYRFPRSWVDATAVPSPAVPAGSMRGFGSFQSAFALECLIDEAAESLKIDPIALRQKNLITDPEPVHTGTIPAFRIHSDLLLEAAFKSSLWQDRERVQKERKISRPDHAYGVGFALALKSYGKNPGDACPAAVTLDSSGLLTVYTNSVDMGNGSATTLPLALIDFFGKKADHIKMGVTKEFEAMELVSSKISKQAELDDAAKNPLWVPNKAISTAASASAYQCRHAVREAAKLLLRFAIWPAAVKMWGASAETMPYDEAQLHWLDGKLQIKGKKPLSWKDLARQVHSMGLITGVMVHTFYRAGWAQAHFTVENQELVVPIDGLAIRRGGLSEFTVLRRSKALFPPMSHLAKGADTYTPYAVVVAVEVKKKTGEVEVVAGETFLECGQLVQRDIVEGQMHGAFAMGIGQALLESYPLLEGGPGQGGWNLHQYEVPRARHCAVGKVKFHIVEPKHLDPPKGMAEVVFNPVPSAIVNALAHASGKRFYELPLRAEKVKEAFL